jgi:hypothetical protein
MQDTVESHIKARRIRRQLAAPAAPEGGEGKEEGLEEAKSEAPAVPQFSDPSQLPPSPFHGHDHLPTLAEDGGSDAELGAPRVSFAVVPPPAVLSAGTSSMLRHRRVMSMRHSSAGGLSVYNSVPIPDLLPPGVLCCVHVQRGRAAWPAARPLLRLPHGCKQGCTPAHSSPHLPLTQAGRAGSSTRSG